MARLGEAGVALQSTVAEPQSSTRRPDGLRPEGCPSSNRLSTVKRSVLVPAAKPPLIWNEVHASNAGAGGVTTTPPFRIICVPALSAAQRPAILAVAGLSPVRSN